MESQISTFDYGQLDGETADFLRRCEQEIGETLGQAATRIGGVLKKAQEKLAQHGYGCFGKWYESMGMKRDKVYALIQRHDLIIGLSDEQKRAIVEELPTTLLEAVSKPSSESTSAKASAKKEVLSGEITTLKRYRERIAELEKINKEAEARAEKAEQDYEVVRETLESIEAQPPKVEVKTEYVCDDSLEEELQRYRERFGDIDMYADNITRMTSEKDITGLALLFSRDVRELIKKYSFLIHFKQEFEFTNGAAKQEYTRTLCALDDFASQLHVSVSGKARTDDAIVVEYQVI